MQIAGRQIGPGYRPYIIAEIGAAHNGSLQQCLSLIRMAAMCGANAVKFQAFTPDTITMDCDRDEFHIKDGPWAGWKLYDLYKAAKTPREWFPAMYETAKQSNIPLFPSVFSVEDLEFVSQFDPPAYKIASFEANDPPLIRRASEKRKPMLISTGMVDAIEADEAEQAAIQYGANGVVMMNCVSSYPATIEQANMVDICGKGLSDHSLGDTIPAVATALGAIVIEKHLTLHRDSAGLDDGFASEPQEFKQMVETVHGIWKALNLTRQLSPEHKPLRRSLYVVKDVQAGETFTEDNVRSIRPANGLDPIMIDSIIGKVSANNIKAGTPMSMEFIDE